MSAHGLKHIYGPVPSRRLGRSLGIDLVPLKTCTYDCVYCQLGRTTNKTVERRRYVAANVVLAEVERKLHSDPLPPDYISVAGSGEPTLNSDVGRVIEGIKRMTSIPVAVLTNGSLLWMPEVQDALLASDLVLPSLDAGDARLFEQVNRPHPSISFEEMVEGLVSFAKRHSGKVWLEVLLLAGVTGIPAEVEKIAALTKRIGPGRVQLNTVCRPPAEQFALTVSHGEMVALKTFFPGEVDIISYTGEEPPATPGVGQTPDTGIQALLQRRPCTVKDVADGLGLHVNEVVKQLDTLVKAETVTTTLLDGRIFYAASQSMDEPGA